MPVVVRLVGADARREVLDALAEEIAWPARSVLEVMRLAPAAEQGAAWLAALGVPQALETLKAQVPGEPPWLLAALQGATVADFAPEPVLVALAREGSDASRDALIADFERRRTAERGLLVEPRARPPKKVGKGVALVESALEWVPAARARG